VAEQAQALRLEMFLIFVDLTKAYDSVDRAILYEILERIGEPPKICRAIAAMHDGMRARVRVEGVLSEEFEMVHGVRQGCVMAPILFNLFVACVVPRAEARLRETRGEHFGVQIVHCERGGDTRVVKETSVFDPRSYKSVQSAGKRSKPWVALL
jgi:hypothetical protein